MNRHARRHWLARALRRLTAWLPTRTPPERGQPADDGSYMTEWAVVTGLVVIMAVTVMLLFKAKVMAFVHGIQL